MGPAGASAWPWVLLQRPLDPSPTRLAAIVGPLPDALYTQGSGDRHPRVALASQAAIYRELARTDSDLIRALVIALFALFALNECRPR